MNGEFKHKLNSGSAFANAKEGNEKRPDWRGDGDIDGVLYNISVWDGATQSGTPKLSFKFERRQPKPAAQYAPPKTLQSGKIDNDPDREIPWN